MMEASNKNSPCKECVEVSDGVQLQVEVEHLRQHLAERDSHIVAVEAEFVKTSARVNNLEEQVDIWREKYERLYDSHKRVQKLNQVLEDKLLQMVDKMKSEKSQLTKDIATLSVRLAESKHNYSMLQKENERYKNDMNLAIQLLQCKPDNFVSQKLDNLPADTQARVSQYVMSKTSKPTSSAAQFKNGNDDTFDASEYEFNISASLMTKILEDSIQDSVTKHCDTCTCTKSQNKPFCYNETYYSVTTQTVLSGEMKNSLCLKCNTDINSMNSNLSIRSNSPIGVKVINNRTQIHGVQGPLYIIPQPAEVPKNIPEDTTVSNVLFEEKPVHVIKSDLNAPIESVPKMAEDLNNFKRNSNVNMEPAVHHKLCDRTKTSISSKISSNHSVGHEELLPKDVPMKDLKLNGSQISSSDRLRKNSHGSMGALSRTSSVAKSTVSTHKSSSQVGPGPRFCHLRMQAGSKNILLDNAEPDVPPVLYRRQSKCNDISIFKVLNDGLENFIDLEKTEEHVKTDAKNNNLVVESTLIDVHVDSTNKESNETTKTPINPVLMNVSSSPLQPLKTHNFSNSSENNNHTQKSIDSQQNTSVIDNLLTNDHNDESNIENNSSKTKEEIETQDVLTATDSDVKIFNFDRYEQSKVINQFARPLRKIDMSQLHSIKNTRISKDFPPQDEMPKIETKVENAVKSVLPAIINVYPNITQTHLKVNENKRVFTNEQSTSSLSSDDSAALLQKQQLLRVAEWVEQNLEQQNNLNDPLEDEVSFNSRMRRDNKLSRLTETLNEIALNMPHPVSKFSKAYNREHNIYVHNNNAGHSQEVTKIPKVINNVVKETIFPVESNEATVTATSELASKGSEDFEQEREKFKVNGDKEITPEDLARMEYNVKQFLLSGHNWANPDSIGRSRRTSSKTETDV